MPAGKKSRPVRAESGPVFVIRTRTLELVLHRFPTKVIGVITFAGSVTSIASYFATR
ncbi:hypothetical protein [Streptomyces sp. NPDC056647]|uniref:hypothetical protein n=1 Tax=Streptomyces sp. NPDC056647 TaxID=3345890 RepID=UPI0036845EA6